MRGDGGGCGSSGAVSAPPASWARQDQLCRAMVSSSVTIFRPRAANRSIAVQRGVGACDGCVQQGDAARQGPGPCRFFWRQASFLAIIAGTNRTAGWQMRGVCVYRDRRMNPHRRSGVHWLAQILWLLLSSTVLLRVLQRILFFEVLFSKSLTCSSKIRMALLSSRFELSSWSLA